MDETTALRLIDALGNGVHPFTGEVFEAGHVCQHSDVIRALGLASRALEERRVRIQRQRNLPANVGKPWGREDTEQLVDAFHAGKSFAEIAQLLKRTSSGVQARLERLGLVVPVASRWSQQEPFPNGPQRAGNGGPSF